MSKLITPEEIIEIAIIDKDFSPKKIKPSNILVAEENYIRPVLTRALYDRINEEIDDEEISDNVEYLLKTFIKPALAYFVVYEIIPEVFLQITNKGGQKPITEHSGTTSKDEREVLRATTLNTGNSFMQMFTNYMERDKEEKKENFPEYERFGNVKNRVKNRGGIIFSKNRKRRC